MKSLLKDDHADVKMIGAVVGILVTLVVTILVFYNVAASIDVNDLDADMGGAYGAGRYAEGGSKEQINGSRPAYNGTMNTLTQAQTFFQIAPIIAIVVVAVVILGYVSRVGA